MEGHLRGATPQAQLPPDVWASVQSPGGSRTGAPPLEQGQWPPEGTTGRKAPGLGAAVFSLPPTSPSQAACY